MASMIVALTATQAENLDRLEGEKASAAELQRQIRQMTKERAAANEQERADTRWRYATLNRRKQESQHAALHKAAQRQAEADALKDEALRRTQERATARAQEQQRIRQQNADMRHRMQQSKLAAHRAAHERDAHGDALQQQAQARLDERRRQKAAIDSEIAQLNAEGQGRLNNSVPAIYKAAVDKRQQGRQLALVHRHEALLEVGQFRSLEETKARWMASQELREWSTAEPTTWAPPSGFDARSMARTTFLYPGPVPPS